ncbi:MAG: glycosyltransferase family 4 protein [Candidatus Omnitrophica bacterium]|nr:glycosyltransferase family 4 protein [Candidatus Omnitrophota bacterium]
MNIFSITMTLVSPPYDDGPKNLVFGIAKRLKKHNFFFVSFLFKKFKVEDNIKFIGSPFQNSPSLRMSVMQQVYIFFVILLNLRRIEVFQFFFTPKEYFARFFKIMLEKANKRSVQVISSTHSLYAGTNKTNIKDLFFSDSVIALSDFSKQRLESDGVGNVVRIYPGVDLDRFDKRRIKNDFFVKDRIPGVKYIIYPGAYRVLNLSYSFKDLVSIILEVKKVFGNVKFVLACKVREKKDSFLEKEFKETARQFGVDKEIHYLNIVDDMPALLNSCDMVILPSYKHLFGILELPLVLLEASALEKPVIYTAASPLDELRDAGIGVGLKDSSCQSYANTIIDLLKDKNKSDNIGFTSKSAIIKNFNLEKMSAEFDAVYNSLR